MNITDGCTRDRFTVFHDSGQFLSDIQQVCSPWCKHGLHDQNPTMFFIMERIHSMSMPFDFIMFMHKGIISENIF